MSAQTPGDDSRSVAIVGMACRFPDAADVPSFWENMASARSSFKDIPAERWNHALFHSEIARELDKTYVRRGAFIDGVGDFAALHFGIAPRRVAVMDPQHRLLLEGVRVALQDAGLERAEFDRSRMGTFLGVSSSEYRTLLSARTLAVQMAGGALGEASPEAAQGIVRSAKSVEPISAFSIPGTLLNMTAANVAHLWNLGGPAYSIDAACASALVAIHDAVLFIRAGVCDTALAGGVYLNLTPENLIGFARASAVSRRGECRPFDEESDGFLQGEGAGVVVLKRLDAALQDGDRIYSVIRGVGINNDGNTSDGPMAPSQSGQADCVRRAWRDAGLPLSSAALLECHGTATKVGDPVEVAALREVFGSAEAVAQRKEQKVWLSSVKANIGHTMSAAGVAGLMRATLALHHETIPPQANYKSPNPLLELEKGPFDIPRAPVAWPRAEGSARRAGVSSFGFGGTNCHVVLEEAPQQLPQRYVAVEVSAAKALPELFVLGAANRELLARHASEVRRTLENDPRLDLADVAYTLTATRKHDPVRLALVASTREELLSGLELAAQQLAGSEPAPLALSPSVFATPSAAGDKAPRVAFLFPGQGAQRVGLLRSAFERFEGFRSALLSLEKVLEGVLDRPLLQYLYPNVSNGDLKAAEEQLQATQVCQPVMAALGLALASFLEDLGVKPAMCAGHSLGEFVAAGAGGLLDPQAALRFVAERGRLMAALALPDPGAMAAVKADPQVVEKHLRPGACIANKNHRRQTVISGETRAVEETMTALEQAGIASRRLRVSHAFHSPLMEGVGRDIARLVEKLELRPASVSVVSAITGETYGEPASARSTFVRHATSSVDFSGALERCQELGADYFLEVGAGNTLTSFVSSGLPAGSFQGTSSLAAAEDDGGLELLRTLGKLAVLGQPVAFEKLHVRSARQVVTLPAAPLVVERYWATRTSGAAAVAAPSVVATAVPATGVAAHDAHSSSEAKVSEDLIKLFREQAAVLQQHAEIIARQTAMLSGQPLAPVASASTLPPVPSVKSVPSVPAPAAPQQAPATEAAPVQAAQPTAQATPASGKALDVVMDAVSKVSAFPRASLKPTQSLVAELGLDSLMVMELVSAIQAAFPNLAEIPQSLLNQKTTIADLVAHVEQGVSTEAGPPVAASTELAAAAAAKPQAEAAVQRYRPVLVSRKRSELRSEPIPADAWTLVTTDGGKLAEALVEQLAAQGRRVAAVRLGSASGEPSRVARGVVRLDWTRKAEEVDGLFARLTREGIRPAALLHVADAALSTP
ncbi:MAG: type I polyketide synthase, partial [Deltaproteobacteria bacterium]|nr:type I polyketide synthase [Deltaproteobacteria bacterium]